MDILRIAINGYGRIGRCVLRALYEYGYRDRISIAAVNDISDFDSRIRLTRNDSAQGRFGMSVERNGDFMVTGNDNIRLLAEPDCKLLPWKELGIDLVMDCTGLLQKRTDIENHLNAGAEKVLLSYPGPSDVDLTAVYGINHILLTSAHRIVSNASCTSNCAVPVLSVIDSTFGIEQAGLSVIHSVMNDQPFMDSYHHNDPKKNRSGIYSIVPVETRLAAGIARVMPHLNNRIAASAVRVPVAAVSAMDFTLIVKEETGAAEVNECLRNASEGDLSRIMGISDEPLVSVDFVHDQRSCIVDALSTRVENGKLLKIFAWFDNEWAYSVRMLDTALAMGSV